MWISVRKDMLANQNLHGKLCPIIGELASSPMEGNERQSHKRKLGMNIKT